MKKLALLVVISISTSVYAEKAATKKVVQMSVTEKGFEPNAITVTPGTAVTLEITRKTDSTCANEVQVPSKKVKKELPLNKMVSIDLGTLEKGEVNFGCGMNMMEAGVISVK